MFLLGKSKGCDSEENLCHESQHCLFYFHFPFCVNGWSISINVNYRRKLNIRKWVVPEKKRNVKRHFKRIITL